MQKKCVIIGGGVAGLAAAIRLTELGIEPMVLEGGGYPAHKICGEFLSPEILPIIHEWKIDPLPIPKVTFRTSSNSLNFTFPFPAGSISHTELDPALANLALKGGAEIRTNTKVAAFFPKSASTECHRIQLSTGETVEAFHAMIATGRIPSYSIQAPAFSYRGFKAYFKNIASTDGLEMYSFPGGYLGISPVILRGSEYQTYNVAGLARLDCLKKYSSCSDYIEHLLVLHPFLKDWFKYAEILFDEWMQAPVPEFGLKQTPQWRDAYFIGDAAVTIPPASGEGLTMGVLSGRLAAEYLARNQPEEFKAEWKTRCTSQLFWAKCLHQLMLHPSWASPSIPLAKIFPSICKKVFYLTRHSR